jgi:hypothetical protein
MNKLVLAVAALALAAPAAAQEARPKIGVGVAIDSFAQGGPTVEVYLPIDITPQFRLEPSLGISTRDEPSQLGNADRSDVTVGIGGFVLQRLAAPVDLYFGGRLKLNFASLKPFGAPSDSGTDVVIAAAVGGEYYLVPKFSLGLEGQLGYYSNSSAARSGEASGFFTTGLAFLRVYF